MTFHYDTERFETLKIGYLPQERADAERAVSEFALAMATFTVKFMQDAAEASSHGLLKDLLLEMYEEHLNDWLEQAR